jgi:hypothetical protein
MTPPLIIGCGTPPRATTRPISTDGPSWPHGGPSYYLPVPCSASPHRRYQSVTFIIRNTCLSQPALLTIGKQPRKARDTYENVGGTQDLAVTGFESRILSSPVSIDHLPIHTYGTLWCGYETMSQSWARLTHTFSIGGHAGSTAHNVHTNTRCPRGYLAQHPVDCMVIDRGDLHKPRPAELDEQGTFWELLILTTPTEDRPLLVVEFWGSASALWTHGPSAKLTTTRWNKLGYTSRCKVVASEAVGGAITQARLVIARFLATSHLNWEWAPILQKLVATGMSHLATHRSNYDTAGPRPTKLRLLWWEFPREHWDALRGAAP